MQIEGRDPGSRPPGPPPRIGLRFIRAAYRYGNRLQGTGFASVGQATDWPC